MKTAMQKMIDYLEHECQETISNQWKIKKAKELLADEKAQIIKAFDDGDIHSDSTAIDGIEYYMIEHEGKNPDDYFIRTNKPTFCKDKKRGKDDECKYPVGSCELCLQ